MKYALWFKDIHKKDIPTAGGKGANLGEMYSLGVPVPNGFVVTSSAYFDFIKVNDLEKRIRQILDITNVDNNNELLSASRKIKLLIEQGSIPEKIAITIMRHYLKLGSFWGLKQPFVAVRSSATAEDLPDASFAGQQETFLNIRGEANVVNKTRSCWASLFDSRAIFYREKKGFDHFKAGVAVPIQKMVQSEVSGVMFTIDPLTNNKKTIVIEAVWGLGETIVQGTATPDHYEIEKETYRIKKIQVVKQKTQLIKKGGKNQKTGVPKNRQDKGKLNSLQIVQLAKIGQKLHEHYFFPQDIEWALEKGKLYIVQTRPITTTKQKLNPQDKKEKSQEVILVGRGASPGIATGPVKLIKTANQIDQVKKGDVLVTSMTSPDFVPAMKRASAIVTDKGGLTSHAAIVSRELSVPSVVGTGEATKKLKNGQLISVNGSTGQITKGKILSKKTKVAIKTKKKITTATKLYVNLAEPSLAKQVARQHVDGIGLLRAEFMIAEIGVHPQKLISEGKQKDFINQLARGLGRFCKHFHPRPVVYRATDFKTNEYRHLEGGSKFEPKEENPLIGYRGALRYINNPEVFALEVEAIKKVRNKMGYKNLWMMIPFTRTPKELIEVKRIASSLGLSRSPSFKLWMMVEIPANVILIDEFIKAGIDGVSIGSNDLTMLTLGLDRDNSQVATEFKIEKSVEWSLKRTIQACNKHKITSSICGQAPSNDPELVEKLVRWGITSISVSPDAIYQSRQVIAEVEKKIIRKGKPSLK